MRFTRAHSVFRGNLGCLQVVYLPGPDSDNAVWMMGNRASISLHLREVSATVVIPSLHAQSHAHAEGLGTRLVHAHKLNHLRARNTH